MPHVGYHDTCDKKNDALNGGMTTFETGRNRVTEMNRDDSDEC